VATEFMSIAISTRLCSGLASTRCTVPVNFSNRPPSLPVTLEPTNSMREFSFVTGSRSPAASAARGLGRAVASEVLAFGASAAGFAQADEAAARASRATPVSRRFM
jgi:hypothetical protein